MPEAPSHACLSDRSPLHAANVAGAAGKRNAALTQLRVKWSAGGGAPSAAGGA